MTRSAGLGTLLLLLSGCGDHDSLPAAEPPYQPSEACPLRTRTAWQSFVERAASDANWLKTCSDLNNCQALVGDFAEHVQSTLLGTLELCQQDLQDNPELAACTARLRSFAPAWLRQHDSQSYGFEQANAQYFAAQVAPDAPPGMMDLPSALLAALPLRADLEQAAERDGWPHLTHDSCLGGVRTFINVVDADDRFEQWLLLGVEPNQGALAEGAILSFLALQKRRADGSPLDRPRVHFRDYVLAQTSGVWRAELPEHNDGKCYACHGSGVRQLLPFPSPRTSSADQLNGLNQRLAVYGLPDWHGSIASQDYGPALGAELGCTHCHDGTTRGPLTVFTSEGMLYQKVVEQLSMRSFDGTNAVPDQPAMQLLQRQNTAELSPSEAQALAQARAQHQADYEALVASRQPSLQAWLSSTSCN
jgi:hypothetical protein